MKLTETISDDQAITVSDIFPTGYFGADLAEIIDGDTVAVFGFGPVGLMAIVSAQLFGAGRVIGVDQVAERLKRARELGAEVVDFSREDPVETILDLTGGIGVDRVIDAVGVDAQLPRGGPGTGSRQTPLPLRFPGLSRQSPRRERFR
ncbi:MAG: zinc-binding dehydrogenase [Syntrophobacteraceae bacterium]|nr:zinc-binding dehydrogenase [Syntrophobacteraceae bacterium]